MTLAPTCLVLKKMQTCRYCTATDFKNCTACRLSDSEKQLKISPIIQLSVRSFVYKDAKIIGAENHHTTRETILTIIVYDCSMQLYIIRTSLSIGTGVGVPLANVSKII